ncbi:hypothetical protein Tco_0005526 [Tanacetum coccineum]
MSNSNTTLGETQSSEFSSILINGSGSKDSTPMLAPGNYIQWKSRIKRYIDTKPNSELIHYCLQNPPYTYQWAEKTVPVAEGSSETLQSRSMFQILKPFTLGWFGKFTSRDGEITWNHITHSSYFNYNHNGKGFVTLVKKSQELKTVSYHKLYDILKQHQNEVNEKELKD